MSRFVWQYRVVRHFDAQFEEHTYQIHERHFELDGKGEDCGERGSITIRPVAAAGSSVAELRRDLERMLAACDKEVLNYATYMEEEDAEDWLSEEDPPDAEDED